MTRAEITEGLVLAHAFTTGALTPGAVTADQQALAQAAVQHAIAHATAIHAGVVMAEIEAAGDPPVIDAHDVWAEAA